VSLSNDNLSQAGDSRICAFSSSYRKSAIERRQQATKQRNQRRALRLNPLISFQLPLLAHALLIAVGRFLCRHANKTARLV